MAEPETSLEVSDEITIATRQIVWTPSYHKCPNQGIGAVRMTWVLSDAHRAINWQVNTGWGLSKDDFDAASPGCDHAYHQDGYPYRAGEGGGMFVCFHFDKPTSVDQDGSDDCCWLGGRRCYGDIGFTMSDEPWRLLAAEGEEAVWTWLETTLNEYELEQSVGADANVG